MHADDDATRLESHRTVEAALAGLSDDEFSARLAVAPTLGTGIGGRTARLDVGGVPVFVKRIPLTDRERHPSTANIFGLPTFYQYGVGSTGFGAWRELATHHLTTDWVRTGVSPRFPLLHHWRILPAEPHALPRFGDWDDNPAVARRVAAIESATAAIVLCTEYLPWTLHEWLLSRFNADDGERAVAFAARELKATTEVLTAYGMVHFDAHPGNFLTDGNRLHLADYGLALQRGFDLSPAETAFLDRHRDWDRWDTQRYLVNWLCHRLAPKTDRTEVIRNGGPGLPPYARDLIIRYAPTTLVLNDFYDRLVAGPKTTPYPAEELSRAASGQATHLR